MTPLLPTPARGRRQLGSQNANSKLTEAQAQQILDSDEPGAALARRLGVDRSIVYLIRSRERWVHLTPTPGSPGWSRLDNPTTPADERNAR